MSVSQIAKKYGVTTQAVYHQIKIAEEKGESPSALVHIPNPQKKLVSKIGDEKIAAFINYHVDMLAMRQGVNKKDVNDLRTRFITYLKYCADHNIVPNNQNAYFAMGVVRQEIDDWKHGRAGSPEHKRFAEDVTQFFSSIHEQGGADGIFNPILTIFWQKAHDGMSDQPKIEVSVNNPLGDARSAEEIAKTYEDLPD